MVVNAENITIKNKGAYHAVSLFSNCGAGDVGYRKAGFTFDVMAELKPNRLEVCLLNHSAAVGVVGDLRETWTEVVETYRKKTNSAPLSLLAACPPCQGMSSARGLRGAHDDADAGSKDKRNLLAVIIAQVAKELMPKIIVVENVPEFLTKKVRHPETNEPVTASNLLIQLLEDNYKVFPIVLDMCDFGVPQSRKRSFLTFVHYKELGLKKLLQDDLSPYPVLQGNPILLREALAKFDLPKLDSQSSVNARSHLKGYGLHRVPVMLPETYRMVSAIPANSGSSAWKNNLCLDCKYQNPDAAVLCASCHSVLPKPIVKTKDNTYRLIKGFKTSYKRMDPEKPAATILTTSATISSHNTIHPFENRVFSIMECMKFQTFGSDFKWGEALKKWGPTQIRKMIGEAVPPKFTKLHGDVLLRIITGTDHKLLSSKDKRCLMALKKLRESKKIRTNTLTNSKPTLSSEKKS